MKCSTTTWSKGARCWRNVMSLALSNQLLCPSPICRILGTLGNSIRYSSGMEFMLVNIRPPQHMPSKGNSSPTGWIVWVDGALVHMKVHDAFKFVPIAHSLPLLEEWITDTKVWIGEIQRETAEFLEEGNLKKGTFRRNEDNCFEKYGRCPFLNICSTCADPTQLKEVPTGYKVEKWEPFDELGIDRLVKGDK